MFVGIPQGANMGAKPSTVILAWYAKARVLPEASAAANEIYDLFLSVQRLEDLVLPLVDPESAQALLDSFDDEDEDFEDEGDDE